MLALFFIRFIMENRRALVTVFVEAENETKLQAKLFDIGLELGKDLHIVNIYPRGSKVVCWLKVESKNVELGVSKPKTTKKKVTRKKKAK